MNSDDQVLFTNVTVLDGTGADPYRGEVLVEGERIAAVGRTGITRRPSGVHVVDGGGGTVMPGLCDAHAHFTWNNGASLDALADMGVEEHTLLAARSAKTYLDCGYTSCVGAASAKQRIDVVIRDAINAGDIPGPRYLANAKEIASTGGALVPGITNFVDGPDEMRRTVRTLIGLGVDLIKLILSGEEITGSQRAEDTYFTDAEVEMAVREAHNRGVRVCAHARSAESVKMCLRAGVDIIYHASFIDEEGMDELERQKDRVFVAPGINWIIATLEDAGPWGFTPDLAEQVGYKRELEIAVEGMREAHRRGIRVLPGGDYGFAWTPHGTYARDLVHFVKLFGFTPMEAIVAATRQGGEIMGQPNDLGLVSPGYLADLLLVEGDPLADIALLQDADRIKVVMKGGRFHKAPAATVSSGAPAFGDEVLVTL
ncbi:amidohydrolase family protein [Acidiferrimicrobium sp. IK]|uniref:metal-dependent hydrolase family protein n=1 Tax=Acidiferrimicrobium sp. IK TaxID=2871700 RepID=UPI0021CB39B6|nr:amidohydrolase family protein [Acidiferrimicrobium sp. IK]MCU4182770.1 amidohydrolase family protein [Acidiferrimicrobium sp. IK]